MILYLLIFEHYMKLNNNNVDEQTKIKEIFDKIYNTNNKFSSRPFS